MGGKLASFEDCAGSKLSPPTLSRVLSIDASPSEQASQIHKLETIIHSGVRSRDGRIEHLKILAPENIRYS